MDLKRRCVVFPRRPRQLTAHAVRDKDDFRLIIHFVGLLNELREVGEKFFLFVETFAKIVTKSKR